ncbi:unnamed protein product, partial [Prorocentrum cordatum]
GGAARRPRRPGAGVPGGRVGPAAGAAAAAARARLGRVAHRGAAGARLDHGSSARRGSRRHCGGPARAGLLRGELGVGADRHVPAQQGGQRGGMPAPLRHHGGLRALLVLRAAGALPHP